MPTPSTTKDVCSILARIPAPCLSQCLLLLRGIAPVKKCAKRQSLMLIKPQRCPTKPGFISSRITPRLFALITPSWANCTRASFCAFEVAGQQPVVVGPPKFGFQTRQRFHRRAARGSNSSRSGPTTVTSFATALVPVAMNSTLDQLSRQRQHFEKAWKVDYLESQAYVGCAPVRPIRLRSYKTPAVRLEASSTGARERFTSRRSLLASAIETGMDY